MSTIAYPDRFIRNGETTYTPNRPHGLHEAMETSAKGEEIQLRGTLPRIAICGSPGKANSVYREAPINVKIFGTGPGNEGATIKSMFFDDHGGGIERVALLDMNIYTSGTYPMIGVQNPRPGRLVVRNSSFSGSSRSYWRTYNHQLDMSEVTFDGADEYGFYHDGTNGEIRNISARNCGRGLCQWVVRNTEAGGIPMTNLIPTPDDMLIMSNMKAIDCGRDGSKAISITGLHGTFRLHGLEVRSKYDTGAVEVSYNTKQNEQEPGNWKTARPIGLGKINPHDLRANNKVVLDLRNAIIDLPQTGRKPIFVDSCSELLISSNLETSVVSPPAAIGLEENGFGIIKSATTGEPVADKSIGKLTMTGNFSEPMWQRTANGPVFMRRNQGFSPAEYYSPRVTD